MSTNRWSWLLADESYPEQIERLSLELAHAQEQCRIAHAMAQDWKRRAQAAETQVERLERKLQRRQAKEERRATHG
jgi:hypothetical protein